MHKNSILTNDVETPSIINHCLSDETGLLDLYNKYNIKSTFFVTGYIAKKFTKIIKMIIDNKHEVGSHGYSHKIKDLFDILSLKDQIENLKKSKKILEDISRKNVISFRASAARVNRNTAIALHESGFKVDSSISSQRFDMFLSFGNLKQMKWIFCPRKLYFTHSENLFYNKPIVNFVHPNEFFK